jgi:hypothetical protein
MVANVKELLFPKTNSSKTNANPLICPEPKRTQKAQKHSKGGAKSHVMHQKSKKVLQSNSPFSRPGSLSS